MQVLLLTLEIVSIFVYADLWLVCRKKRHIFEPLLALISVKQRKVYQNVYRQSLIRTSFCVSDKVDVSGSTFNTCFCVTNIYSFLINTIGHLYFTSHIHHLLWLNGLLWFAYMMFSILNYKDPKELCFYCKYTMGAGAFHFVLLCIVSEGAPYYLLILMLIIFCLITITSYAERSERKRIWKEKQKKMEAKKQLAEREKQELLSQVEITIDCPGSNSQLIR